MSLDSWQAQTLQPEDFVAIKMIFRCSSSLSFFRTYQNGWPAWFATPPRHLPAVYGTDDLVQRTRSGAVGWQGRRTVVVRISRWGLLLRWRAFDRFAWERSENRRSPEPSSHTASPPRSETVSRRACALACGVGQFASTTQRGSVTETASTSPHSSACWGESSTNSMARAIHAEAMASTRFELFVRLLPHPAGPRTSARRGPRRRCPPPRHAEPHRPLPHLPRRRLVGGRDEYQEDRVEVGRPHPGVLGFRKPTKTAPGSTGTGNWWRRGCGCVGSGPASPISAGWPAPPASKFVEFSSARGGDLISPGTVALTND